MTKFMSLISLTTLAFFLAALSACNPLANEMQQTIPETPSATAPATENNDSYLLYVNSQEVDCMGVAPQKCLQVRRDESESWNYFYDAIEGFTFEPGFVYTLRVHEEEIENPPADASSLRITLEEVVSKTPSEAIPAPTASPEDSDAV